MATMTTHIIAWGSHVHRIAWLQLTWQQLLVLQQLHCLQST
jgi:hypothetical protein